MPALKELLTGLPQARVQGDLETNVSTLANHSRQASPDSAFFCIRGYASDGHNFAADAVARGATTLVVESGVALPPLPNPVTIVEVEDTRCALASMAAEFYSHPSRTTLMVGVTGTNGKTTVTHLIAGILREAGLARPAVIGTLGAASDNLTFEMSRTTPDSLELQRLLAAYQESGSDAVVMEVSSHALALHRVDNVAFDAGVFTNLTPEHQDFHPDMESYFLAKSRLFNDIAAYSEQFKSYSAVLNVDDAWGRRLRDEYCQDRMFITYAIDEEAHVHAEGLQLHAGGAEFVVRSSAGNFPLSTSLVGRFNVYNILAAVAFALTRQIDIAVIQRALEAAQSPEGRMEMINCGQDFHVAVDYAHTPDGLQKVLSAVREFAPSRVITVMGCGGDRDRLKRPEMGMFAASLSDVCVITSDNPRSEEPMAIIDEILAGTREGPAECLVEPDRRQAIEMALRRAAPGDFVLIAGKGHETYQIIKNRTIPFDDREVVREFLEEQTAQTS